MGGDTPVSEGLQYLINSMYGTTGIVLATLAIIAVGLLCLLHVLEWKRLIQTIAGIGIIFGAGAIVSGITALIHTT
jgi:type IV secretory pathway VirB2 component (pilin)